MLVVLESCARGQILAKNLKFRAQLSDQHRKIDIVYPAEIREKSRASAKVFIGSTKDFISKYVAQIMQQSHFLLLHIYANSVKDALRARKTRVNKYLAKIMQTICVFRDMV